MNDLDTYSMEMLATEFTQLKGKLSNQEPIKLRIASDSMHPILKAGDFVSVTPCQPNELKRFDIIVYFGVGRLVSQFIWATQVNLHSNQISFITKSLKEPLAFDTPVTEEKILGKLMLQIPVHLKLLISLRNFLKI